MSQQQRSINDLLLELNEYPGMDLVYRDKMMTKFPDTEVINRNVYILDNCIDKRVLDIGCAGPLHKDIREVASKCYGIDQTLVKDDPDFLQMTIGKDPLPVYEVDLIICGEIIEHLSNPGLFLDELKKCYPTVEKIITVPNAFASAHAGWTKSGKENTNRDHVAYYSYTTMSNLLTRHGYKITNFYWYDNPESSRQQGFNEGLVFVAI